jgi:EF-P beta-lysylation protein EpmB
MSTTSASHNPTDGPSADPNLLDWQVVLADAVTDPAQLCRELDLPESVAEAAVGAAREFSVLVPRTFLARMRTADPFDPLLAQVLPREVELEHVGGFKADPLGETHAIETPGLLQKYANRSLIVTTGRCGVHCRFCFRRHFAFPICPKTPKCPESVLRRIAADPSIHEIILSGGDPLTLADENLHELTAQISQIPHIRRLRVHTRLPILVPQRVTDGLLSCLSGGDVPSIVVIHVNHPAEIDRHVARALGRLVDAGVPVLSQSVLLRGVNDQIDVLAELFERLVDLRVMPYYLHQLDRVAGAAHFEVPEETGVRLVQQLRTRLPGYAVPRYVREIVGAANKVVLV